MRDFMRMFANLKGSWPHRRAWLLATLSGLLFAVSFCGFDQDYLGWFCLLPALWAIDDPACQRPRQALAIGWMTGFVAHLGVYTWLVGLLRDFGYLPLPLAILGYTLVCFVQSLLFGLWGYLVFWLTRRAKVDIIWAAPCALILVEWAVPALFPSYLANGQYQRIVLLQACSLWGVLGLSYLLALSSSVCQALLSWALGRRRFPVLGLSGMTVLVTAVLLYGYHSVAALDAHLQKEQRTLKVGLVQTNMGIYEKTLNPEEGLKRHRDQSLEVEAQGAELVVWSESGYFFALDPSVLNVKREVMGRLHTPLLFGGMRVSYGPHQARRLYNSAFLTDTDGTLRGSYDKTHLLAFGEFLPFGEALPWLYRLSPQSSHFHRGTHVKPLLFKGMRLGTLICYEDILPRFVRHAMEEEPDILVNLTNDAWFGLSNEPRIHLALATFRAVEQRRFLVRSTNTGISAIVDPAGRILNETPVFARANLVGEVKPMHGVTLYQHLGDWPGMLAAAFVAFHVLRLKLPRLINRLATLLRLDINHPR